MSSINSLIAGITKLDGSNYYDWAFDIEMLARWAGTWDVLRGETERLESKTADWDTKSNDVLTMIGLSVAKSELAHIRGCKTAPEMWKALSNIYSKSSRANHIALWQQLNSAVLKSDDTIQSYVSRISSIAGCLHGVGVKLSDQDETDVLIMNLPEDWGSVASALMIRPGDLSVKDVVGVLLEEEMRRKHTEGQAVAAAALVACGGTLTGRGGAANSAGRGQGRASVHEYRTCYRCGEKGHIGANCPQPPAVRMERTGTTEKAKVAFAEEPVAFGGIYHL